MTPTGPPPDINWQLLEELAVKPHPLLHIADNLSEQLRAMPEAWVGEVFHEARTAHHLLDLAGIPHRGRGESWERDHLDARTYLLLTETLRLRERLDRIHGWHSRETGPAGTVGDWCNECGHLWPCPTRRMAEGTYTDDIDA